MSDVHCLLCTQALTQWIVARRSQQRRAKDDAQIFGAHFGHRFVLHERHQKAKEANQHSAIAGRQLLNQLLKRRSIARARQEFLRTQPTVSNTRPYTPPHT